ncbi:MAG: cobaltochelatase subunit CobT [Gammaproteobacteria bacterium]|nr:cobaltochelatase subunit CobT [Gammaproteobacteria bacterium]MDH5175975.1 cobaltochelatase subunit CobT [Gammaproteobacteria bacterium]MDH5225814.1 cobaltochelatase subunit CobT [Gammaproteobacteria bacterium]
MAERGERALTQVTRALAGNRELDVSFGPSLPGQTPNAVRLPVVKWPLTEAEAARVRGHADHLALRSAYHDPALHTRFRPTGSRAREIFDAVEDMRCQSLGGNVLAGVAHNLTAALVDQLTRKTSSTPFGARPSPMAQALALLVREKLTGLAPPPAAAELMLRWRDDLSRRSAASLDALAANVGDQQQYAFALHELVEDLGLGQELGAAAERRKAAVKDIDAERPGDSPASEPGASVKKQAGTLEQDAPELKAGDVVGSRLGANDEAERKPEREPSGERMQREPMHDDSDHPNRHYRVFTTAHDVIMSASELCGDEELTQLRSNLDRESRALQPAVSRLAIRLERLLLAKQTRRWQFDLEEGVLDAARLARVLTDPLAPLAFREESEADFKDTVVSILLDNSGSMRGRPIMVAALCADVLARTLERCGVKVEILGFTTREWSGGHSREDWLKAGRPAGPGRLTDLRYIVYKPADVPYRRARRHLGVMLKEDLLKDNVDGEALLWAHERLLRRNEQRRILMALSDGVPLCEATLSANPGGYLEQHLRNVVKWIETRSPVELVAIGIGHDVTDFYQRAVAIPDVEQLGNAMIEQLADLFVAPGSGKKLRGK